MLQTDIKYPFVYNPASQTPEDIVSNFVIRLQEFDELFTAVKNDKMEKPTQHFIIQGQRGYGKTTLLLRLNYEILNDKELSEWLLPVIFDEEQYRVNTLAKLWEEVIDILEDKYEFFNGLIEQVDHLYDLESPEEEIFNLLIDSLKKRNKKAVLLIDNFGEMIGKFSKKENQRLREVLITCSSIRVIGASSAVLEFYYSYKEPLYDFFKVITLDELTGSETIMLLRKLSETYQKKEEIEQIIQKQPERIEALRRLTGSVPRTVVLLFEIFTDDADGNSFKDLEAVLDMVTPLYKHRLDNLSTQQQIIVDAVAQNWDAISTKSIAKKTRMSGKAVSAQLNQLEKSQIIEKQMTSTKNQLYRLKERFFNIYFLMRLGKRKNRNRVLWLVRFFELWCGEQELIDRVRKHIKAMKEGKLYYSHAFCVAQALSRTKIPLDLQHELISKTREYLSGKHKDLVRELDKLHIEVMGEVYEDIKQGAFSSAKKKLLEDGMDFIQVHIIISYILYKEKIDLKIADEFYYEVVREGNIDVINNLAMLYETEFKDYKKTKEYYLIAVDKGNVKAMFNLAMLYETEFKDYEKAKEYYLMAIEKGNVEAMKYLAFLYETEFKDYEKAKEYYLMAIEKGNVEAMKYLAFLYETEFKDYEKAKEYYLMAIEKGNVEAMKYLAFLYETEFKDYEKAKEYYLMAIEKGNVEAMKYLAFLYETEFKDYEKAKEYYLMAIKNDDIAAMNNLACLYYELKTNKEDAWRLQKEAFSKDIKYVYGYIIVLLWNNDIEEAVKMYKQYYDNEEIQKEVSTDVSLIIRMFIAKKQYHFVYQLFSKNRFDLKDKYKPVYFALLSLMGAEYRDEFIKMGSELKQTVEEILDEIKRLEKEYV